MLAGLLAPLVLVLGAAGSAPDPLVLQPSAPVRTGPRIRLAVDLPLALGAAGGWLALDRAAPGLTRTSCPCALGSLNALDRTTATSRWSAGGSAANVTLATSLVGSGLLLAAADPDLASAAQDLAVASEAAVVAGLLTAAAKIAFARPYPFMFAGGVAPSQERDGINYASMWSGHTAVPLAAAVATALLLERRGAPRMWRLLAWTVGPALALAAGALQVSAGNHFLTDVAVGAAVGTLVGGGVTVLHLP